MKPINLLRILLAFMFVFVSTQSFAKTIKWSMQGDSLTLDPHAQNEGPTTQVSRQIYEALVTRGLDMTIGPQLATKWKAVDPNTWYFFLRDDVKFSNGQKMTSDCLLYTSPSPRDRTRSRMPSSA